MTKRSLIRLIFTACCLLIISFWGCASAPKQDNTLAFVDGEPVTRGDLEYSLEVAHRREDLSTAKTLDIKDYIQKLIDDRLIVQEAWRMGMDGYPVVQDKVRAYLLRESVVRLYNEEVLEKVSVTEEDINDYYKTNYERFTLDIIETGTEEDAGTVLLKLKSGESFEEFSRKYPASFPKNEGGEFVFTRKSMPPAINEALDGLNPGEFSDVTRVKDKFYIIKLISREEAPVEDIESVRERIEGALKKQKIKERSDEYLAQLRRKASIDIDQELLSSIQFDKEGEEKDQLKKDNRPLVEVNGAVLSVGEFVAMLPSSEKTKKENILNKWLDRKVVDQEALSRHYEEKTDLKNKLNTYKNQLIKNTFLRNVIASKINITDEEVKEYYLNHQEDYTRPSRYKIQQISLKSLEDAQEVLKSLQEGANFSWMAKTKSADKYAAKGGVVGWKIIESLRKPVVEIIDTLEPGDNSPILQVDDFYRIIRLMEKRGEDVEEFDRVKALAYKAAYKGKFREMYDEYVNELRKKARIEINDEAVRSFEKIFKK